MSPRSSQQATQHAPPNDPWRPFHAALPAHGYASFYYCDELGAWPVRSITRVMDNKSDPNIETGTYGLFSTCEQKMRSGIVTNRARDIFFISRPRNGPRQISGYYEIGWYTPGALRRRTRDFALAARTMRFVDPIPLPQLPDGLDRVLGGKWRLTKRLDPEQTARLRAVLDGQADRTDQYVAEIDRLERLNAYHSGYRYPTWRRTEPLSWADAGRYLQEPPHDPDAPRVRNSSPTGWWRCTACPARTENAALLKACPHCHNIDTLRPLAATDLMEAP
jgi:hypothetical protein